MALRPNIRIFGLEYSASPCRTRVGGSGYSSNPNRGSGGRIFDLPFTDKSQNGSGSMRGMFGRKTAQATISPTGDKGYGAPRTHSQRSVWTNRSNNVWRNELLPPLYRRLHENDAHLSPQEQIIGGGIGEVQRVQAGSGKAEWKGNQAIENR